MRRRRGLASRSRSPRRISRRTSSTSSRPPHPCRRASRSSTLLRGFEAWASRGASGRSFTVTSDLGAALRGADVVMALRIQRERMASGLLPSLREYAARYGLTRERLAMASPDVLVMHPGPINEGVEIAPDFAVDPRSVIVDQVTNGVAVRMALLYLLAGARERPRRRRSP